MSRLSVVVLNLDGEDAPAITSVRAAADKAGMAFDAISGTFEEVLDAVGNWTILPEIVFVQAPEGMDAHDAIHAVGSRFPEGEAEIIIYSVPNDISVYRALKSQGVREVFSGVPDVDEVTASLEDISSETLRRTGIDPRKAVYVFSAHGGAGGSAVATSMARKFSRQGRRTLFIDLDLSTAPASFMFGAEKGARETTGLLDALASPARIDALFLDRVIDTAGKNLYYLSARHRQSDDEPVPHAIPTLIARAQESFDMVVIDIPWRCNPQPDMAVVHGHAYVVAKPSPAGLLGYSTLMKELENSPGKSPIFGIVNCVGEFKNNDITVSNFRAASSNDIYELPYDPASAGRMFYEQKTFVEMSGKVGKAFARVLKTLPGEAVDDAEEEKQSVGRKPIAKAKRGGLFKR